MPMLSVALRSLGRDTALFGLGGALSRFLAIFTLPILTSVLSKAEYGSIDAAVSLTTGFAVLIILGQDAAIARFFYDGEVDTEYRQRVASSAFGVHALLLSILGLGIVLFGDAIGGGLYGGSAEGVRYWKLALWLLPGAVYNSFSTNVLKWTRQRNGYLVMTLGSAVAQIGLTLLFVLHLKWGVFGAIWAAIVSTNLFALLGLILISNYLKLSFLFADFKLTRRMLAYGAPFTVVMIPAIDRYFLLRFADLEQVGVYAVGVKISGVLALCTGAFSLAFGPYAFSIWDEAWGPEILAKVCKIYFASAIILTGIIGGFGELFIRALATTEYLPALVVLPPLLLAVAFGGLFEFCVLGILKAKRSYYHGATHIFGMGVLVFGNYILVPHFSIMGAAMAALLARASVCVLAYLISQRYYRLPIELARLGMLLVIWGAHAGLIYLDYVSAHPAWGAIKLGATVLLPWLGAVVAFSRVERREAVEGVYLVLRDISEIARGGGRRLAPTS